MLLGLLLPLLAAAQTAVGGWELFTPFNGVSDIIETPAKIYYLSGNPGSASLFSYDKETDESYSYHTGNKLNDNNINFIKYNPDKHYLAVAYASGNIDVIKDDGAVVNLADIKDAPLAFNKNITYIGFDSKYNNMYVCTNFGIVRYNDDKFEVVETGMYDVQVDLVGLVGDYLLMRSNNTLRYIRRDKYISRFANFNDMKVTNVCDIRPLEGNKASVLIGSRIDTGAHTVYVYDFDFDKGTFKATKTDAVGLRGFRDAKNYYTTYSNGSTILIDKKTGQPQWYLYPCGSKEGNIGVLWDEKDQMWVATSTGLNAYKIGEKGTDGKPAFTTIHENIVPAELTIGTIKQLHAASDGSIYMGSYGPSRFTPTTGSYVINVLKNDGHIYDVTNFEAPSSARSYQGYIATDPAEPNVYWGSAPMWANEYIYKVRDGKQVYIINKEDRPAATRAEGTSWYPSQLSFDTKGNLWVLGEFNTSAVFMRLPAAKVKNDEVKASDWEVFTNNTNNVQIDMDARMAVCRKSNAIIIIDSKYGGTISAYNTRGTDSMNDDTLYSTTTFIDQDGKKFEIQYLTSIVEDNDGAVWIGSTSGVISIEDPESFSLNPGANIKRLKVPRNDGTNFADYLLDAITVRDIAVDSQNRKWIATEASGVYLVSADGTEILENFTTSNSLLPSNTVFSVVCDPLSNNVYFGTEYGLAVYSSTSSPAADNYDNVYAYPNPVRPDYTGWITVTGLMDNSLVKIADAAGNVFYSGRSEGGMITWDGCNSDGQRVRTGVYFVFASQNQDGTSGVVAKILVVN